MPAMSRPSAFAEFSPSRVEVDAAALAANARLLKARVGAGVEMMAVVKADAYGHGALTTARAVLGSGVRYLAAANMAEALALRAGGIDAPLLLLSHVPPSALALAVEQRLTVSIFDLPQAAGYAPVIAALAGRLKVHVKVDSGMGRLGVLPGDALELFRRLRAMPSIEIEGIYTHFSLADEDPAYTARQLRRFEDVLAAVRAAGFAFRLIHAANSAALLNSPASCFNLVRPGILLYGLKPAPQMEIPRDLQPALAWKTAVAQVKTLPPHSAVGYGNVYRTRTAERLAVLPVGYADGLRRTPQTWREVLVRGQRAPLVGRPGMEKTIISVSHLPAVSSGDEVVLLGRQGSEVISADEIAAWLGTVNYEILTMILPRVPRA